MTGKHSKPAQHAHGHARARRHLHALLKHPASAWRGVRWLGGKVLRRRWVQRTLLAGGAVIGVLLIGGLGLWWRLNTGPINLDVVTPWLTAAISQNFGGSQTVTIGGTQIERDEHGRAALRISNIVVRDPDGVIVASAPKADVSLAGGSLLFGKIRAERLNLVGAELSVRIETDGKVTVFAGANTRPIAVAPTPVLPAAAQPDLPKRVIADTAAALSWIDGLGASGLDGHGLSELGLADGNLTVDDQRSGKRWTFSKINISLSRASRGGLLFRLGSDNPDHPWQVSAALRPLRGNVRAIGIEARKVALNDVLLAARVGGGRIESDVTLSSSIRAEFLTDGTLRQAIGEVVLDPGHVVDLRDPDMRINLDHADVRFEWDGVRQTLLVPFQVKSDGNQFTMLATARPSPDGDGEWQFGIDRGDPVIDPVIFSAHPEWAEPAFALNRIVVRGTIDVPHRRIEVTQGDVGRTDTRPGYNVAVAVTGHFDWEGDEPKIAFGVAGTRMPMNVMKRLWPVFISTNVRAWVNERISAGTVERVLIAGSGPLNVFTDPAVPLPDDSLSIEMETSGTTIEPVPKLPPIHDADLSVRIDGRAARVTLGGGTIEVAPSRKLNIANGVFEIPDTHPKPSAAAASFRIDGSVGAAASLMTLEPLKGATGPVLDPASSRGTVAAKVAVNFDLGRKGVNNVKFTVNADLGNFVADGLVLGQKVEAQTLHVVATSDDFRVKGDAKLNGVPAKLDFHQAKGAPQADIQLHAMLDETSRKRLGINFGQAVVGTIPVTVNGKVGSATIPDLIAVDADFTPVRIDQLLPGWVKAAGKSAHVTFNLVQAGKTTRFDNLTLEGQGALAKGSVEFDSSGDLTAVSFPVFALSSGDQASLKAERSSDGTMHVQMRGDVYDGRQFIKAALSEDAPAGVKPKQFDLDLDVKLGAVAGSNGEAIRGLELKLSRRGGKIRSFNMKAKIGRDTPLIGELRLRTRDNHQVIYIETNDAGALLRFTDIYPRMFGGQMWMAMDPPSRDPGPQIGVVNIQNFVVRGEPSLERVVSGAKNDPRAGVEFSEMRCDFTRVPGRMIIRDGVVRGPVVGATIDGQIDYARDELHVHGTFVPLYGLNNMFGQIPIVGLFLGGGSNEGLVGINYEASGPPSAPRIAINPISAVAPGLLRKFIPGPGTFEQTPDIAPAPAQPTR
jgi:hypothetical protein